MSATERRRLRPLRFLSDGPASAVPFGDDGRTLLVRGDANMLADIESPLRAGLVRREGERLVITDEGRAHLKRAEGSDVADQHRAVERRTVRHETGVESVAVNANESPLARLRHRRDRHGRTWLDDAAFEAGERLRRDFSLAHMEQKVTASWDPTAGAARGRGGAGDKVELSDGALDARRRLDAALASLDADLAGVTLDVCCFLKGLETVERERRWPPRSAKLMLRTALNGLARHYGTHAGAGRRRTGTRHWGGEGYRPTLR